MLESFQFYSRSDKRAIDVRVLPQIKLAQDLLVSAVEMFLCFTGPEPKRSGKFAGPVKYCSVWSGYLESVAHFEYG